MNYIYELHRTMMTQKVILVYEGDFTQETTKSILSMAERNLDSSGEDSGIKRKVFNVMVEALQNIVKHSSEQGMRAGSLLSKSAIFLISKDDKQYCVMTGNPIAKDKVAQLTKDLNDLNSKDKEGLKEMYKEIIKNTQISEKGGAGLGFVDMARKSGEKLEFLFANMDAEHDFFCLKVNIAREKE
ncbi:MAG: SiaB family protein kinase [Bacteroidetes bacterium]|nr:SiaB family protein kinase [Bacteroidota bacterium]MBS1539817.1 SiaB family protein kinase [Bacteroidota bacterium]